MRKIVSKIFALSICSLLLFTTTFAGVLDYSSESNSNDGISVTSIVASNRAQFIAGEIVKGLDLSDIDNFDPDSIDTSEVLENLGPLAIGTMTIKNDHPTRTAQIKLKIDITTVKEGHIGHFVTDPAVYVITVPFNDSEEFSNLELNHLSESWVSDFTEDLAQNHDWDAIKDDVIASALLAGGDMFPQREYTIKVTLIEAGTTGPADKDTPYVTIVATIVQPLTTGQAVLSNPIDDAKITMSGLNFTFRWYLAVRTAVDVSYTLFLYEVPEDGTAQTAIQTEPILVVEDIKVDFLDFPTNDLTLEQGKKYAWLILSLDSEGNKIGTSGLSVVETFEVAVPDPPNLNNPIGEVETTPIFFSWSGVEGADRYKLTIALDMDLHQTIVDPIETDSIFISVGNENRLFEPGKKFYWNVQALDAQEEDLGDASKTESFEFKQNIELQRPIGGEVAMIMPPEFSWSELDGAEGYNLMVATDPGFENEQLYNVDASSYQAEDTDFFTFDKIFYWKVQATNSGSDWGLVSGVENFKSPERAKPEANDPVNGSEVSNIDSIRFSWVLVNWAKQYDIELYSSDRELLVTLEDVGDPPFEYKNPDGFIKLGKQYSWNMIASDGDTVKKSGLASFSGPKAEMPLLYGPLGQQDNMDAFSFSWESVPWAKGYKLYIADNQNMDEKVELEDLTSTQLSYTNDGTFEWESKYFWTVEPYDKNDNTYGFSGLAVFSTSKLTDPELIAPNGDVVPDYKNVNFDWTTPKWADKYNLLIARNQNMGDSESMEIQGSAPFTYTNDVLKLGRQYFWQIEAINDDIKDGVIKRTRVGNFKTKDVPIISIIEPRKSILDKFESVLVSWTDVEGAEGYQLFVSETNDFSSPIYEGLEKSYSIQDLEAAKKYTIKIIAVDEDGKEYGKGSNVKMFYTADDKVIQPAEIISPIGRIEDLLPILKWLEVEGADEYMVKIAGTAKTVKTVELALIDVLTPKAGARFTWSVQAMKDGKKFGFESKTASFTLPYTEIELLDPVNKDIKGKDVKLTWKEVSYVKKYEVLFSKGTNLSNAQKLYSNKGIYEIKDIEPGQYTWQVVGLIGDVEVTRKSKKAVFTVKEPTLKTEIELISPVNTSIKDEIITLKWKGVKEAASYKVTFGNGSSFQNGAVFKTKEEQVILKDLENANYSWQVHGVKENGLVLNPPSKIASFKYEYQAATPTESVSSTQNATTTGDIKEKVTFIEATKTDIDAFNAWMHEFLKSNGSAKMLENMTLKDLLIDGSDSNINKLFLEGIMNKEIDIKSIEVK